MYGFDSTMGKITHVFYHHLGEYVFGTFFQASKSRKSKLKPEDGGGSDTGRSDAFPFRDLNLRFKKTSL